MGFLTDMHNDEWRSSMPHYVNYAIEDFCKQNKIWMDDVQNQLGLLCGTVDTLQQNVVNLAMAVAELQEKRNGKKESTGEAGTEPGKTGCDD